MVKQTGEGRSEKCDEEKGRHFGNDRMLERTFGEDKNLVEEIQKPATKIFFYALFLEV